MLLTLRINCCRGFLATDYFVPSYSRIERNSLNNKIAANNRDVANLEAEILKLEQQIEVLKFS